MPSSAEAWIEQVRYAAPLHAGGIPITSWEEIAKGLMHALLSSAPEYEPEPAGVAGYAVGIVGPTLTHSFVSQSLLDTLDYADRAAFVATSEAGNLFLLADRPEVENHFRARSSAAHYVSMKRGVGGGGGGGTHTRVWLQTIYLRPPSVSEEIRVMVVRPG